MTISIREGDLDEALRVDANIPEFRNHYTKGSYVERLGVHKHLILTAYVDDQPAGYKIGYDRYGDGSFYSWMGGVLLAYRKQGVAQELQNYMERWCKEQGYTSIKLKTRNRYKNMLRFALKNNFNILDIKKDDNILDNRFLLEKQLK